MREELRIFRARGAATAESWLCDMMRTASSGGRIFSTQETVDRAFATRPLNGEAPAGIKTTALGLQTPQV